LCFVLLFGTLKVHSFREKEEKKNSSLKELVLAVWVTSPSFSVSSVGSGEET